MYNFPTGSFLQVKLPQILLVGKVRKTRTTARHQFVIKYLQTVDYLTSLKDLTG